MLNFRPEWVNFQFSYNFYLGTSVSLVLLGTRLMFARSKIMEVFKNKGKYYIPQRPQVSFLKIKQISADYTWNKLLKRVFNFSKSWTWYLKFQILINFHLRNFQHSGEMRIFQLDKHSVIVMFSKPIIFNFNIHWFSCQIWLKQSRSFSVFAFFERKPTPFSISEFPYV